MTADLAHALSIDVEDYFQVLNLAGVVDRSEWDKRTLRCDASTRRLLDLFDRRDTKATFFFLGWIAERLPDLVRDVASAGHEIGSHGYDHQLLPDLGGAQEFSADLARTEEILESITGAKPTMFRACTWSITQRTPWALDVLAERGYRIDSSIYPVSHVDYGVREAPTSPYRIDAGAGREMVEFPPLTWQVGARRRLPVGGGGYLRLFPIWMLERGLRQQAARGWPGCVYLHPWEVDPDQPREPIKGLRRFRHYVNLRRTLPKLDRLISRNRFVGLEAALAQCANSLANSPAFSASKLIG